MVRLDRNIDIFGLMSSGLCALHCMALPLMMSLGFWEGLSTSPSHHLAELVIIVMSFILVVSSIYKGVNTHDVHTPYWFFGLGMIVLVSGLCISNHWAMGIGGSLIALGHLLNFKLLHRKRTLY